MNNLNYRSKEFNQAKEKEKSSRIAIKHLNYSFLLLHQKHFFQLIQKKKW